MDISNSNIAMLITETATGCFTEQTSDMRRILVGYAVQGGNLILTEEEIAEFENGILHARERLRKLEYTVAGINESYLQESADSSVEEWKDQVDKALKTFYALSIASNEKDNESSKSVIAATLIGLVGSGVAILTATEVPVLGVIIALVTIGAALYQLYQAVSSLEDQEKLDAMASHVKNDLRMKAKRILPQLDALEHKLTSKASRSSLQALRSTLEAIALDEYEEDKAREASMLAANRAIAYADVTKMKQLQKKQGSMERDIRELKHKSSRA
jgi:hypothetical protein